MQDMLRTIQQMVRKELEKLHTTEIGVVTAIFPLSSESGKENYQCSLKLKNKKQVDGSDFELRKVNIAAPHLGWVNIPNVGDLVAVSFIQGDINSPVVLGRLYNDEDRPPLSEEKEFLLKHHKDTETAIKIDAEGKTTIAKSENTFIEIDTEGNINIKAEGEVKFNNGAKGAARLGDEVEVVLSGGEFLVDAEGGAPVVVNPPSTLKGKITSASGNVLIGD